MGTPLERWLTWIRKIQWKTFCPSKRRKPIKLSSAALPRRYKARRKPKNGSGNGQHKDVITIFIGRKLLFVFWLVSSSRYVLQMSGAQSGIITCEIYKTIEGVPRIQFSEAIWIETLVHLIYGDLKIFLKVCHGFLHLFWDQIDLRWRILMIRLIIITEI